MIECPRCNGQGLICKGKINGCIFCICDECDACWEKKEDIYNIKFKDLDEFLNLKGIVFNDSQVEYLEYLEN